MARSPRDAAARTCGAGEVVVERQVTSAPASGQLRRYCRLAAIKMVNRRPTWALTKVRYRAISGRLRVTVRRSAARAVDARGTHAGLRLMQLKTAKVLRRGELPIKSLLAFFPPPQWVGRILPESYQPGEPRPNSK